MRRFFAVPFVLAITALTMPAQEPAKKFTLRWHGQSFFSLETPGGKKLAFDPHLIPEFGRQLVKADIIVCSHLDNDHTQVAAIEDEKSARVFYGTEAKKGRPADWKKIDEKVGAIRIRTVGTFHDTNDGLTRGKNSAFVIEADGLTFCHLGDLGHELSAQQLKAVGKVDVLMIPVGGVYTINGEQAKKVVAQIKPRLFVLPMHYGVPGYDELQTPDEFLDGQMTVKKMLDTNELVIPADAKADAPTIALLGWKKEK